MSCALISQKYKHGNKNIKILTNFIKSSRVFIAINKKISVYALVMFPRFFLTQIVLFKRFILILRNK